VNNNLSQEKFEIDILLQKTSDHSQTDSASFFFLMYMQELDTILHSAPPPEPKHQLRRSSSAPF